MGISSPPRVASLKLLSTLGCILQGKDEDDSDIAKDGDDNTYDGPGEQVSTLSHPHTQYDIGI